MNPVLLAWVVLFTACDEPRDGPARATTFEDIRPTLAARCDECHATEPPAGGWRSTGFLEAIACVGEDQVSAVAPGGEGAPLLRALARPDHVELLSAPERARIESWIAAGAPARRGAAHAPGMIDPRSLEFHGLVLRSERWARILDPDAEGACAGCHGGAPGHAADAGVAPGATPCTSCHSEGPLVCTTCHGPNQAPAAGACVARTPRLGGAAHAAHVQGGAIRAEGLSCTTCHPARDLDQLAAGAHGDGHADIAFDPLLAGEDARFDAPARRCAVACHGRGGAREVPAWTDTGPLGCQDCHQSPPPDHFPGPCSRCHAEPDDEGTSLRTAVLHVNGTVDRGDGSGTCGACHGEGEDPWPRTGAHAAHRDTTLTVSVACESCHQVPADVLDPGHLDSAAPAEITFGDAARARGAMPVYDGAVRGCDAVACHGEGLGGGRLAAPRWDDTTGAPGTCGACHGLPPPAPHPTATSCESLLCHGGEVARTATGLSITEAGRALHMNGVVDVGGSAP